MDTNDVKREVWPLFGFSERVTHTECLLRSLPVEGCKRKQDWAEEETELLCRQSKSHAAPRGALEPGLYILVWLCHKTQNGQKGASLTSQHSEAEAMRKDAAGQQVLPGRGSGRISPCSPQM